MQTKIIDYQNQMKTKEINKRMKLILIGFFLLFLSVFGAKLIFADINVEFDKQTYSIMEGTSTRVGFTIYNNSTSQVNLWVWTDCDDEDEELSCNYSQRITMPGNSTQTSSFYVSALDDSSTYVSLYVNNLNTNQTRTFRANIDVVDDEEDGEFEIEVYNSTLCIGKTNRLTFEINNNTNDGLYNLFLTSDRLQITQEYSNPVYLRNEKEIDYYVFVPENTEEGQNFNLRYSIENDRISEVKLISVYTRKCVDTFVDFSVTGPTTSYYVNKGEEKSITYVVKNNSRNNKTIYISEEHTEENIDVSLSKRQITLSANSSQEIEVKFKTTKDIRSGNYDLNFNFFDGINNINRKLRIVVNPEHSISVESLSGISQTLVIGKNLDIYMVIRNKGDIREEFTITTSVDNDVRIRTTETNFSVSPNSNTPLSIYLSAGERTQTGYAYLYVEIKGKDSDFYQKQTYIINVIRDTPTAAIDFLSYPRFIDVLPNSTQDVDFVLKNTGSSKIIIDYIEVTNVSQEITITSRRDIVIEPNETKTVPITINIGELKENQNAKIRFVTRNGAILEKTVQIKLPESKELEEKKSGITGFLTLRNSLLTGILIVCLAIILLFVLGIFKTKRI